VQLRLNIHTGAIKMINGTFKYGRVLSLKLNYADCPSTRDFYCIDKPSVEFIRFLASQSSFPVWEKPYPEFWRRKEPQGGLLVSKTPAGWLAMRRYRSAEKTLTHLEHVMPILFPAPGIALAASELCYPKPHPALCWSAELPECMTDRDAQGDYALGKLGWERSLRDNAWVMTWPQKGRQVSPGSKSDEAFNSMLRDWPNPAGVVH
jgi:hypothetical protein